MRQFTFTPEVLAAVCHDRYHHPHPRVQQKMEVVWLKSQGCTHEDIARLAAVSRRSVQRYLDEFADGGVARLRRLAWKGKANELAAHQAFPRRVLHRPSAPLDPRSPGRHRVRNRRAARTHSGAVLFKKLSACAGVRSALFRPKQTRKSWLTS
jgi:hypothetical protein